MTRVSIRVFRQSRVPDVLVVGTLFGRFTFFAGMRPSIGPLQFSGENRPKSGLEDRTPKPEH